MKKIMVIICSVVIFISSLVFYGTIASRDVIKKDVSKSVIEDINLVEPTDIALRELGLNENDRAKITLQMNEALDKVKSEISGSPEYNQIIDKYSSALLDNITQDNPVYPNIDKDVKDIIDNHEADIVNSLKGNVSESETVAIIENIKNSVNLQSTYINLVNKVKQHISPEQAKIMNVINVFNNSSTMVISLIALIGAIVLIILIKRSVYTWSFPVAIALLISGICLTLTSKMIQLFGSTALQMNNEILSDILNTICSHMFNFGLIYAGIAIVLFIFHSFMNRRIA